MFGHDIFWFNCLSLFSILSLCTIIGRQFAQASPFKLKPHIKFFLSPAIGLAIIVLLSTLICRTKIVGESIIIPITLLSFIFLALAYEKNFREALEHIIIVSVFGSLCAIPLLLQLFMYGGYNAHNDTFTYLAHSDWLQHHAFSTPVLSNEITPIATQTILYQQWGLRIGASCFLAFFQAILHCRWAYWVYPSAILAALVTCSLSIGLVLSLVVARLNRFVKLGLLILPCLGFGGLTFGSLYGFFPQTVGLAMGGAVLFLWGALLPYIAKQTLSWRQYTSSIVLSALLFAASGVAYSELIIFVLAGMGLATIYYMIKTRRIIPCLVHSVLCVMLSCLFMNLELPRMIKVILIQSKATTVVGAPVNWPLTGFIAHQFNIHGGVWDIYQWTLETISYSMIISLFAVFILIIAIILYKNRKANKPLCPSVMLPSLIMLLLFSLGIIYFRYFAANPFSVGVGQSWNQFKLSDWSSPFASTLLIIGFAFLLKRKYFSGLATVFVLISTLAYYNMLWTDERLQPLKSYYSGIPNLAQFYQNTRDTILSKCPAHSSIYLNLTGNDFKFRQIVSLFLADQKLLSDWREDTYIVDHLPPEVQHSKPALGDCLVEKEFSFNENQAVVKANIVDGHEEDCLCRWRLWERGGYSAFLVLGWAANRFSI